jgi:hypothetical protein
MSVIKIPDASYARILRLSMKEAEAGIAALVERAFADLPLDASELPIIGGWPFTLCNRTEQKQFAVAALKAVKWFESEAPRWARPLLLTNEDCLAVADGHHWGSNHRALLRSGYGQHARMFDWVIERLTPFEVFCANQLSG